MKASRQLHNLAVLSLGKRQRSSLNRKLGTTHTRSQSFEKDTKFCSCTVTMRTELLRLRHKSWFPTKKLQIARHRRTW